MEGTLVMAMLLIAAMLHGSLAQTTHVVGDALGWTVPPGGDVAYRTWASNRTFTIGDSLVFNFTTGMHNVEEVTREAYNSCNSSNPISVSPTGPTTITLTSGGQRYFICGVTGHCTLGQRLAINISASAQQPSLPPQPSSSAPQPSLAPSTPEPSLAPSPSSRVGMTYTVGDSLGWTVPPGGAVAYQTWTRDKTFAVGDVLVFNFTSGRHNVVQVTRAQFEACNASGAATAPITTSPARITLTAGEHYYMCTFPLHCSLGQQLAINVGTATAPSPTSDGSPTTGPPSPRNSATSIGGAAFKFTLLTVGLAFLV